jgi:CubicO group peptidase (beta-lactamase class C family)
VDLAWDLVGQPLQMSPYYIMLAPKGEAYMGGGGRFLPRDFLKLAQLYANGGTWNGRRIVSAAWVRESAEPRFATGSSAVPNYGYLWWSTPYDYRGRRIFAHHASGNGGQYSIFIPELGLVIAALGGNYADRGNFVTLRELIPRHILPAVVR